MNQVTIVMYHYVRPLQKSKYPKIKGLELEAFKGQIAFFCKSYQPVTMEQVLAAVTKSEILPKNALLLTFDDGYRDHFEYVFPILKENAMQGSFFPPGMTVFENKVLDVNKIHYILASVDRIGTLIEKLFILLDQYRKEYLLPSNKEFYQKVAIPSRYDDKDVMFVKRMLQKNIPMPLRSIILNKLFTEYVASDEKEFSHGLYASIEELHQMKQEGMCIGGHGHAHNFFDIMSEKEKHIEIDSSLQLLRAVGQDISNWVMCYPYGAYDQPFLQLLKNKKCALGLTLKIGIANVQTDPPLELPRLDTNDFPTKI